MGREGEGKGAAGGSGLCRHDQQVYGGKCACRCEKGGGMARKEKPNGMDEDALVVWERWAAMKECVARAERNRR